MSESEQERILSRVKKMMALANDAAATEGERDNALRMAHATLAKYNLTMAQADATGAKGEKRLTGGVELREHPWMRTVAMAIAKLFFCHFFYTRHGNNRVTYSFIGKESNVWTAQSMTQYVIKSIDEEARRSAKVETGNGSGTYWRSFAKGAAHRVYQRCDEIQRNAEAASKSEASTGTSLVLASVYQAEDEANALYMQQIGLKLKTARGRQRTGDWDARAAGAAYGDRIGLHTQVGGGKSTGTKRLT